MERNFETVMIEQCAPVLAGLKPAGLFRYETRDCTDLAARVRCWNDQLGEKGLKVRVLKGCAQTHRYLIYVYRESRLRQVLADEAVREFLQREGYALPEDASDCDGMLRQLSRRLCHFQTEKMTVKCKQWLTFTQEFELVVVDCDKKTGIFGQKNCLFI